MNTHSRIVLAIAIAAITACSMETVTRPSDEQGLEQSARSAIETGNYRRAAELYRQLADRSSGAMQAQFLIEAARWSLEIPNNATARRWLIEAQQAANSDQQKSIFALLAHIELDENHAEAALQTLALIRQPVPVALLRDIAVTRGRAYFSLRLYADAVSEFVAREVWLDNAEEILANQAYIWDGLRTSTLERAPALTGDRIIDGWLALTESATAMEDMVEFRRSLLAWRSIYVDHPAAGGLLAELLAQQRLAQRYPRQIAILLPLSSTSRSAATAIRDGFLAAHLADSSRRETTVRIYDTSTLGAEQAYLNAQLDGADFIVGPLLRPNVEQVIAQSGFVPTLALNFSESDTPFLSSFYQFALWPEDEARAVAQQAVAAGAATAVAIVASDDRGYRVLNSFRSEFEALGGRLLDFSGYDPQTQDYSAQIEALLNISRSHQRRRRLAANLGLPVEFEPRRRQDVDMIFLQASAQAGRLLAPQLRFNEADDIPTYATHDIYEPGSDASDIDLNGVIFPDAPILLRPDATSSQLLRALETFWPESATALIRFYGMGFDAHGIMMSLFDTAEIIWPLAGVSGELSIDEQGRIHRSLPFAQFRNGRPVSLPPLILEPAPEFVGFR